MGPVPFTLNTLGLIVLGVFRTLFLKMLFSDEAGGCAAVREAFILSLSHCRGGREGGKEIAIFIWQWCGRHKWWFVVFMLV